MTTTDLAARIDELTEQGLDDKAIAAALGVPVARVERILDQAAGADGADLPPARPPATPATAQATRAPESKHGTVSGHQAHKRRGEEPCDDCKAGARAYWNARSSRSKPPEVPVTCLVCDWKATAPTQNVATRLFKEHYAASHPPLAKQAPLNLPTPPALSPTGRAVVEHQAAELYEFRVVWPDGTHSDVTESVARAAAKAGHNILARRVTAWRALGERTESA